jgi:hypothetical protein
MPDLLHPSHADNEFRFLVCKGSNEHQRRLNSGRLHRGPADPVMLKRPFGPWIFHNPFSCVRITPHEYTRFQDHDKLLGGKEKIAKGV